MLSSTVRRSLLSLLAVSTVGTLGFSAAATLGMPAESSLGAGESDVTACASSVSVKWTSTFVTDKYVVGSAVLNGVTGCEGLDAEVTILDESDAFLAQGTVTIGSGATASISSFFESDGTTPVSNIPASDVGYVAVVIADS